jgi:hypothetical protein
MPVSEFDVGMTLCCQSSRGEHALTGNRDRTLDLIDDCLCRTSEDRTQGCERKRIGWK